MFSNLSPVYIISGSIALLLIVYFYVRNIKSELI